MALPLLSCACRISGISSTLGRLEPVAVAIQLQDMDVMGEPVTRHAAVDGNEVRFRFTGKSGKQWLLRVKDRRIAKIIRACQELPGQELLQYLDDDGKPQDVTSTDVNDYLKEITGQYITAKDFR